MAETRITQPVSAIALWAQDNIIVAQAPASMPLAGQVNVTDIVTPTNGEIFGLSVTLSEVVTGGSLLIAALINGVPLTRNDVGVALGSTDVFFRELDAGRFFTSGQRIEVELSSAGLIPLTVDVAVVVYCIFNRGTSIRG